MRGLIELVILACAAGGADGESCDTFRMQYDPYEVSLMTCIMAGQPEVARWAEAHPGWEVRRWSCGVSDPAVAASDA